MMWAWSGPLWSPASWWSTQASAASNVGSVAAGAEPQGVHSTSTHPPSAPTAYDDLTEDDDGARTGK